MALFQDKTFCSFEQYASLEIQICMAVLYNPNSKQKYFRCHMYVCDYALTCFTYMCLNTVKQRNMGIIYVRLLGQARLKRNQSLSETFQSSIICKSWMENITRLKEQCFFNPVGTICGKPYTGDNWEKIILCSAKVEISKMRSTSSGKISAISAE